MATSYQRINQWRSDVQPGKPAPPKVLPRSTTAPPTIYANDSISVVASRPYTPPRPAPIPVPGSAPIPPKRAATLKRPSNTTSGPANAHARTPSQPSQSSSQPSSGAFSKLFGRLKSPNASRAPSQNRGESPAPVRRATSPAPVTSAAPKSSSTQQQPQVPVQYVQYPGLSNGQLQYYTVLPNGTLSAPVTPGSTPGAYYYHPMTATSLPPVQTCPACGTPVLTNELHMHLRAHGYQI